MHRKLYVCMLTIFLSTLVSTCKLQNIKQCQILNFSIIYCFIYHCLLNTHIFAVVLLSHKRTSNSITLSCQCQSFDRECRINCFVCSQKECQTVIATAGTVINIISTIKVYFKFIIKYQGVSCTLTKVNRATKIIITVKEQEINKRNICRNDKFHLE